MSPSPSGEFDSFDEFLVASDPARILDSEPDSEAAEYFAETRSYWDQLSHRRVKRRRRVQVTITLVSLAAVALLAVGAGLVEFGSHVSQLADGRTKSSSSLIQITPETASTAPIENGSPSNVTDRQDEPFSRGGVASRDQLPSISGSKATRKDAVDKLNPVEHFVSAVKAAGQPGTREWKQAVTQLTQATPNTQRLAIDCVAKITVYDLRTTAFQLVCDAAGESETELLSTWLSEPNLRTIAFDRLAATSSTQQRIQLATQARTMQERQILCHHLASSPDPGSVDVMLKWSHHASWRAAIRSSLDQLHPDHVQRLVLALRQRDRSIRTAAAFLLASVPGDSVDRVAASMILEKRYLQPAYIALLARRSPGAQLLLTNVMQQRDLSAAFYSAQLNFQSFTEPLQQWLSESQGQNHDTSKQQRNEFPIVFDPGFLLGSPVG